MNLFKVPTLLFTIQIQPGILYTDKRNAHLHCYLFAFLRIERKISTNIISCYLFSIAGIKFIFSLVRIPFCLYTSHRSLFLPIPCCYRCFLYPHHKINRKYSLRIITECTKQLHSLNFAIAYTAKHSTTFICQSLSQI